VQVKLGADVFEHALLAIAIERAAHSSIRKQQPFCVKRQFRHDTACVKDAAPLHLFLYRLLTLQQV